MCSVVVTVQLSLSLMSVAIFVITFLFYIHLHLIGRHLYASICCIRTFRRNAGCHMTKELSSILSEHGVSVDMTPGLGSRRGTKTLFPVWSQRVGLRHFYRSGLRTPLQE